LRQLFKFAFFLLFPFLAVYFQHIQHIWVLFHHFAYFISVFIWVFSFVHISNRFACYSWDYYHSFVFACFLVFVASYIYIFGLRCEVGSIWCWFEFRKNRKNMRREVWACEDIKSVWAKHERCEDFVFTTNQFLHVVSCHIKTTHQPLTM
jgi:hypothetical protein